MKAQPSPGSIAVYLLVVVLLSPVILVSNSNQESWLAALRRTGFDESLPTFVLWEGVHCYLKPQASARLLEESAEALPANFIHGGLGWSGVAGKVLISRRWLSLASAPSLL